MSYIKKSNCPYCDRKLEGLNSANHIRWCDENPKRAYYNETAKSAALKRKTSNQFIKARELGLIVPESGNKGKPGTFLGKSHNEATRKRMSESALLSDHRRLCRSIHEYLKIDGSTVMLDSSWEVALARRLDELKVDWIRPPPIRYSSLDDKLHNYFPDFYLPKYNLFIDPKNPIAFKAQKDKISILVELIPNLIFLRSLEECENFMPS